MSRRAILLLVLAGVCVLYLVHNCLGVLARRYATGLIPVFSEAEVDALLKSPVGKKLVAAMEKLRPLHRKMGPVQRGDWLDRFEEPGQTFREYLAINPVTAHGRRNKIYVQPLGEFTGTQRKIVTLTAEFIGCYFSLPVKIREDLPLSIIPAEARRDGPLGEQILTGYVLGKVLAPRLPDDAAAYIAFTASDLWAGPKWNFVFGQARLTGRVGVWSIRRFGEPEKSGEDFKITLLRTLKLGTHETGHMFSILHCIAYECNMCGCNHLAESDRHPVYLCPECMPKVCWATRADPVERYKKLAAFCKKHGLKPQQEFYEKSARTLAGD